MISYLSLYVPRRLVQGVSKAEVSESAQHLAVPFTICCAPTPSPKLLTTAVTPSSNATPKK